jgi:Ca2+-binding EF-hand superfamily protein
MTREGKEPMAPAPSAPCEPSAPAEPSAPGEPSSAEPVGEQHESHAEKLTYESFCKLAREREGVAASDVELRARFAALDLDGSGKADLNEYNCHCLREALRRSSSRVIDLFRSWDVDGSGEVDREEFRRAIRQLNLDYVADDAAIDRMFALFDDDDNGTLEYHELRKQLSVGAGKTLEPLLRPGAVDLGPSGLKHRLRRRDSIAKGTKMVRRASVDLRGSQTVQEQLKAVLRANAARVIDLFREWDDDGNGTISKKEFRQGLRLFGLDADRGELDALFDALDKDGGGTLDFKELDKALRNETEEELDGRLKASAASRRLAKSMSAVAAHLTPRSCGSKKRRAAGAAGGQQQQQQQQAQAQQHASSSESDSFLGHKLAQKCPPPARGGASTASTSTTSTCSASSASSASEQPSPSTSPTHLAVGSVAHLVARDAVSSPNWQMYQLKQKACKMLAAKDRGLPMAAAARSTRHVLEHSKRIVPPPKPKPATKAKRKDVEGGLRTSLLADDGPKGLWGWVQHIFAEFRQAMAMILNGLLEQELEVQMFAAFLLVSALVSLYTEAESVVALSQYESGRAPPAPPAHPDWTVTVTDSAMGFALSSPLAYLLVDFGTATFLGVLYYWWEDIKAWNRARLLRASKGGYQLLGSQPGAAVRKVGRLASVVKGWKAVSAANEAAAAAAAAPPSPRSQAVALIDAEEGGGPAAPPVLATEADLQREISREIDKVEELETKLKVHTASGSPHVATLAQRAELHRERLSLLKEALVNMAGDLAEKQKAEAKDAPPPTRGGLISEIGNSGFIKVLKNSMTGFVSVYLFYVDVLSDVQVVVLLWDTGNWLWCAAAAFFLVAQYMVVYTRVLPYMRNTFGASSCLTCSFTYLGFPLGLFILDFLMLLEPFGLLAVLPLPAWLKQFVPACERARVPPRWSLLPPVA